MAELPLQSDKYTRSWQLMIDEITHRGQQNCSVTKIKTGGRYEMTIDRYQMGLVNLVVIIAVIDYCYAYYY